jgi:phage shock protein A
MVLVERDVLQHELETVFDAQTTETLLRVLDKVASQVYAATAPRTDFSRLERLVERIAEEQARLSKDVQKLTEQVQLLIEAQRRNEERFSRMESDIAELKTDVSVLKTDVSVLKTDVSVLKTDVSVLKTDVSVLKTDVSVLKTDVSVLKTDVSVLKTDVGHLKGDSLERKYRDKAPAYFGRLVRKPQVVDINRLWDTLETHLSKQELADVLLIDLIVKGKSKACPETGELYLAIEISAVVDRHDVERAQQRATFLWKAGFRTVPVVAGNELTAGAEQDARTQKVAIVRNGRVSLWDEALAAKVPL